MLLSIWTLTVERSFKIMETEVWESGDVGNLYITSASWGDRDRVRYFKVINLTLYGYNLNGGSISYTRVC